MTTKWFHVHRWELFPGSGFSRAGNMRKCLGCPECQTQLFDIQSEELVWVKGNFMEDIDSPIFIIAETHEALKEVVKFVPEGASYYQVRTYFDLGTMQKYKSPRFILAKDWKETDISNSDDFRVFLMTGHF